MPLSISTAAVALTFSGLTNCLWKKRYKFARVFFYVFSNKECGKTTDGDSFVLASAEV